MKKFVLILLILVLATPVWAQTRPTMPRYNNTLNPPPQAAQPAPGTSPATEYVPRNAFTNDGELVNRQFFHGVLAAPVMKFSTVNEQFGLLGGGRLGWILNHNYTIGVGGYGLFNDIEANELDSGATPDLTMRYGGVEFEYVIEPQEIVHFSVYTLVGMGNVEFDYADVDGDDNYFVVEPAVNILLNVTEFFRVGLESAIAWRRASI